MNENKVAFIICTNDKLYCNECLHYISMLEIPKNFDVETILIEDAEYMTKAYNKAMKESDAKYKVYMHQDTFLINKNFIYDMFEIFKDKNVGMIGIVGSKILPSNEHFLDNGLWDTGCVYVNNAFCSSFSQYSKEFSKPLVDVQAVDGMFMVTQYDISWRDDLFCGWDFYDISQSMEFLKQNYKIIVPNCKNPWIMHDHGILNYNNYFYWKDIFFNEYNDFILETKKKFFKTQLNNLITIDNSEMNLNKENSDIYINRHIFSESIYETTEVTIAIIAYNRLETTKLCVESVLRNTSGINFKLILVYNDNEQGKGILEYFNSVEYENKLVIHIKQNAGAPFAYLQLQKYIEGKYFVHLPNDVIVTPNWLSNLIKCAESDVRIGMVNPASSNITNYQCVNLNFDNYEQMQKKAGEYNISDPSKWHERLRLMTIATLFTRECLLAIGNIFDCGFIHNFGDDDVSFRVRRAGYKTILALDTWVHHDHMSSSGTDMAIGRANFREKYYGIDAWDDVNNYVFHYIEHSISAPQDTENVNILGIDVKCGTPVLDIKNTIRKYNVFNPNLNAFSTESKYDIDLRTICNGQVVCDKIDFIYNSFRANNFDYIIIENEINEYDYPEKVIRDAYALLKSGGEMFVSLKNTYNVFTLLELLGHNIDYSETARHYTLNSFYNNIQSMGINIELVNQELFSIDNTISDYISDIISNFKSNNSDEDVIHNKLQIKKYWFKIKK